MYFWRMGSKHQHRGHGHRLCGVRVVMDNVIWFLTGNAGKLKEAQHHFSSLGYDVRGLVTDSEAVTEPQADDLETVALAKLEQARTHAPTESSLVLVEDAGLFVEALNEFPGVYSSFAYDTIGCHGILRLLSHLNSEDPVQAKRLRASEFRAVACLWNGQEVLVGRGVCPGSIASEAQGDDGFGFDPIFIPADLDAEGAPVSPDVLGDVSTHGATFGSVDVGVKHVFSHRRRAMDDLLRQLPQRADDA